MAREMGHVLNRDILIATLAATIAGAVTTLANMAQWAMIFGSNRDDEEGGGGVGLFMMILAPLAAGLIQMAVSRAREYGADQTRARLAGDPLWLASALAKLEQGNRVIPMRAVAEHPATAHMFIVNPLSATSLASLFSTHPPVEERIRRLQFMAHGR